jgi:hypothetical protein
VFEQGQYSFLRCEVFKSDGDSCDFNWSGNRYVRIGTEFKLIAAVWVKKFVGFEQPHSPDIGFLRPVPRQNSALP